MYFHSYLKNHFGTSMLIFCHEATSTPPCHFPPHLIFIFILLLVVILLLLLLLLLLFIRWLAAYYTAASFRYSHYYVVLISESSTLLVGLGFVMKSSGDINWNGYRTIHPSNIELPRSLGSVVTSWNLPMHHCH